MSFQSGRFAFSETGNEVAELVRVFSMASNPSVAVLGLLVGHVKLHSKIRAQAGDLASIMELTRSLEMTEEQKALFAEQEKLRIESRSQ